MAGTPLATAFVRIVPEPGSLERGIAAESAVAKAPVITPRVNTAPAEGQLRSFISGVGGKLLGALAIGEVLKTGLEANSNYQKGLAQLQAGLKSTGDVAGLTAEDMEKLADKISGYSGQNRNTIVGTEQLLLAFRNVRDEVGKGNDIFTRATQAAADMAARMGGDAAEQARKLGRALDDPIHGLTLLTRSGVTFTDSQKALIKSLVESGNILEAQKVILDQLDVKYGGSAKAVGQTLPGEINKAKNSFEELTGSIVSAAAPALDLVLKGINGLGKAIFAGVDFLHQHEKAVLAVVAAYAALKWEAIAQAVVRFGSIALAAVEKLTLGAVGAIARLRELGQGSVLTGTLLSGLALGGIGLLTYGLLTMGQASKEAKQHVDELLSGIDLTSLSGLDDAINKINTDLRSAISFNASSIFGAGQAQVGTDQKTIDGLNRAKGAVHDLAKQYGVSTDAISAFAKANGVDLTKGLATVAPKFQQLLDLSNSYGDKTLEDLAKLKLLNSALGVSVSDALAGQATVETFLTNQKQATTNLANAQDGLKTAQQGVIDKQAAYNTALAQFGSSSDQAKAAYRDLQTAVKGVTAAQQTLDQAQPPTVDSILKKLGLDDATLNQLTGAAQKLAGRGLSANAFSELLSLNDPRAIIAFANGPQSAIGQLNSAVSKFLTDSGPESFTSLQKQFKASGTKGIQSWAEGVTAAQQVANDAYVNTVVTPARDALNNLIRISKEAGGQIPDDVASRMLAGQEKVLNAAIAAFPVPVQKAIRQSIANIEAGRAPGITKAQAFADGINSQTAKILTSIGITVGVDDQASQTLGQIKTAAQALIDILPAGSVGGSLLANATQGGSHGFGAGRVAAGGLISGPGSGTSDSIPVWLSNGEYVMPAATVKQLGVGFFDGLRAGGMAAGGLVGRMNITLNEDQITGKILSGFASLAGGASGAGGSLPSGDAVNRWAPLVLQVLAMIGQPASWLPNVLRQIATESGGNPNAINNWDSNAAIGQNSRGLLQTVPGTFAAYAGRFAGLGIFNPEANIFAALNYAVSRYGSLGILGQGHGYDNGGPLMPGWTMAYNGTGRPENVSTHDSMQELISEVRALRAELATADRNHLNIENWHGDRVDARGLASQAAAQFRASMTARRV